MRSLLKYLKDYKKESILAPVFKMHEASFELFGAARYGGNY